MKISIILSTYNRYKTLSETLLCLCQQEYYENIDYEIIVIDNNSNDKTKETIESFIKKNSKIRYIFESKQGISNARNAGINIATGEILAFIDDDVTLAPDYLLNIIDFDTQYSFDALGGKVLPQYPSNTPRWVKDCKDILSGPIVCHDYGETIKLYDEKMLPFIGANMVIKKEIFQELGNFNSNIGSGKGTMGEDTELFRRIQNSKKKIYYNPKILAFHPVEKSRMKLSYLAKWHMALGKYFVIKNAKAETKLICYFRIPRYLFPQILKCLLYLFFSITNKRNFIQAWVNLFTKFGMAQGYRAIT